VRRTGREMVYRHTPREARCLPCADGLNYRPSQVAEGRRRSIAQAASSSS
jgi:hypothetical protein